MDLGVIPERKTAWEGGTEQYSRNHTVKKRWWLPEQAKVAQEQSLEL